MSIQVRNNLNTIPFIRHGIPANVMDATILQDAARTAVLARFTVLGKSLVSRPTSGTAGGSNTGNGTCTAVALAAGAPVPIAGTWTLTCTTAVTNGGIFSLTDPNSNVVATNLTMVAGAGTATIFTVAGMIFTLTDGSTDFAATDTFTILSTAVNKYLPLEADAVNGLEIPKAIFMGEAIAAADIVAADVEDQLIMIGGNGVFIDEDQVVLENSLTLDTILSSGDSIREALQKLGIIAEDTDDISEYENT